MKRSPMKRSTTPMKRTSLLKSSGKKMKSRGMKGAAVSADEKRFHEALAKLGCIACHMDGVFNPNVSIHHIDGRTKPGAHREVLPLCAQHHQQDDTDPLKRIAVHPNKARFEARYGRQYDLLTECLMRVSVPW